MASETGNNTQGRIASLVSPSPAMTIAGAFAMCPAPMTFGPTSAWMALYQHAYAAADRQLRIEAYRRATTPSLN